MTGGISADKPIVLGIYGSPREGGNSDILLDRLLEGAAEAGAEIRRIYARSIAVAPCLECGGCDDTGSCVIDDGMRDVYPLLLAAHAVVVASPVFFYGMSAQVKALIDRCQALWNRRRILERGGRVAATGVGYLLMVGAARGLHLFLGGEFTAKYFFQALLKEYGGGIFFRAEQAGEVLERSEDCIRARLFGAEIAESIRREVP